MYEFLSTHLSFFFFTCLHTCPYTVPPSVLSLSFTHPPNSVPVYLLLISTHLPQFPLSASHRHGTKHHSSSPSCGWGFSIAPRKTESVLVPCRPAAHANIGIEECLPAATFPPPRLWPPRRQVISIGSTFSCRGPDGAQRNLPTQTTLSFWFLSHLISDTAGRTQTSGDFIRLLLIRVESWGC